MQAEVFFFHHANKRLKKNPNPNSKTTKATLFVLKIPRRKNKAMDRIHNAGCLIFRAE